MSGARAETPREDAALLERDVERVVDVERASLGARTSDARARTPRVLALAVGLGALGALGACALARATTPIAPRETHALGVSNAGWLNVRRDAVPDAARLGVDATTTSEATETDEFDVDAWLANPRPVYESTSFTVERSASAWALVVRDARELWKIPVNKRGGGYRLGNVVKRRGKGWLNARSAVVDQPEMYKDTLVYSFLEARTEGVRAFAATVAARERSKRTLSRSALAEVLPRSIVMPMRLSDKVAFMERNEKLIVDAALDFRRSRCPEACNQFVVSLSLVWGGDEDGKFLYDDDEYKESIRVLRSLFAYAKEKFPPGFELSIAVTSDADDAMTMYAYAPHLMANPIDSASTIIELAHEVNALITRDGGEQTLLNYYDGQLARRRKDVVAMERYRARLHDFRDAIERARLTAETSERARTAVFAPNWFDILRRRMQWPEDVDMDALDGVDEALFSEVLFGVSEPSVSIGRRPSKVIVLAHDDVLERRSS